MDLVGTYLGPAVITAVETGGVPGSDFPYTIVTVDGHREYWNAAVLTACVTETASDLTTLREKRTRVIAAHLLGVLLMTNAKIQELEYLFSVKVIESVKQSLELANAHLWGMHSDRKSFVDLERILKDPRYAEDRGDVDDPGTSSV